MNPAALELELFGMPAQVEVEVVAPFSHLCPFADERDDGTITVRFQSTGYGIELRSLVRYLKGWAEVRASHEAVTASAAEDLTSRLNTPVRVETSWTTAGLAVTVKA